MKRNIFIIAGLLCMLSRLSAQTVSLDGEWDFAVDSLAKFTPTNVVYDAKWRKANIPLSWQAQFPDLRDYQGVAWYKKSFTPPKTSRSEKVLLHFGAVDYVADVYVNGVFAGRHEGGYTPFDFEIQQHLSKKENTILVRVMDPVATEKGTEGISYWNIPHGKQSWYVQTSGIWQSVALQVKPSLYVRHLKITPAMDGKIAVDVTLGGNTSKLSRMLLTISGPDHVALAATKSTISRNQTSASLETEIAHPLPWSFDSPTLYTAKVTLSSGDTVTTQFGFRTIETKEGKLLLNGVPFYLIGALDQDFYPESIYSTPSEEYLRDEMLKAKKIGLNTLRCHIKVPDPRYLKVADEVGMIVWYEIPNWDNFTPESGKRGLQTLQSMIERDCNHPSLCMVSLINESWGLDLQKPEQRTWLKDAFNTAKKIVGDRLVVDNSACWGNFHVKSDINDWHTYWSIPEHKKNFTATLNDFSTRPDWLYSKFGDAEETRKEPLLLSEFGNWGLPNFPKPYPWWIERRFGDAEVALPLAFDKRFAEYGYDKTFVSFEALSKEAQRSQFDALKWEIEEIRLHPQVQGYIITEFTDINWESNGLLDMWRNVKYLGSGIALIQQQDVIIPRPARYNYWPGDSIHVKLCLSHYQPKPFSQGILEWVSETGEHGSLPVSGADAMQVQDLPPLSLIAPQVTGPRRIRVDLTLKVDTAVLASNFFELFVFPKPDPSLPKVEIYDPLKKLDTLAADLRKNGYTLQSGDQALVVSNTVDEQIVKRLQDGAKVLCLVDTSTKLPASIPLAIIDKDTTPWYDGNWASNFNWVRNDRPPFGSLSFGKRLGFEATEVLPKFVIGSIPPADFKNASAGMFIGWLHKNGAYVHMVPVGKGTLVLCTLRLADALADDPYAATLFRELVNWASSAPLSDTEKK